MILKGGTQDCLACEVRVYVHDCGFIQGRDVMVSGDDFKECACLPVTANVALHIKLARAQRTSADRLDGALREGEALRVEINALRQNLEKAEGDKTRVRAQDGFRPLRSAASRHGRPLLGKNVFHPGMVAHAPKSPQGSSLLPQGVSGLPAVVGQPVFIRAHMQARHAHRDVDD